MTRWLQLVCFVISIVVPAACCASEPLLVSTTDLGRTIIEAVVTPDGRWAVAEMKALADQPAALQIIDISSLDRPKLRGSIPIEQEGRISLSADGRLLLFQIEPPPSANGQVKDNLIKAFDLADPDHPKEAWRRSIAAYRVALAPNGLGYVALLPNGNEGTPGRRPARIEVHWVDRVHTDKTIEDDDAGLETPALSSNGSMLLLSDYGNDLTVFDLRGEKPVAFRQTGYSAVIRYECPQVLETGNVIVRSAQWPRLEILSPQPELPRVATVRFDRGLEGVCSDVIASAEKTIYLKSWGYSLTEVDITHVGNPAVSQVWSTKSLVWPVGADAAKHLFAYGGDRRNQFFVFDLNHPSVAKVDWTGLALAHEHALRVYREHKHDPVGEVDAQGILEQADVQRALGAEVGEISSTKASAILNDYGFLVARPWINRMDPWQDHEPPPVEPYLRRSIELDRGRAVAQLNLADLLRNGLGDVTVWEKKSARVAEIERLYRGYLSLGGTANARIDAFLQGDPGKSDPGDICGAIAAYANAGRLNELVSFRPLRVVIEGRKVDLVFFEEGTSHSPNVEVFDATTGEPLPEKIKMLPGDEQFWGGDHLALVTYHDVVQILHFKDMQHPVSTFLPSGKRACAFRATVRERVDPHALEPALCMQLTQGKGPESLKFSKPASMSAEEVRSRYGETEARGLRSFDALNDGRPINVVQLELSSGAGAGCGETFFDAVDEAGEHYLTSSVHDRLMALQLADSSNRYPVLPCGNAPRFFQYNGKTYFETKPFSWPPDSSFDEYHGVRRSERDNAVDVCNFRFITRIDSVPPKGPEQ